MGDGAVMGNTGDFDQVSKYVDNGGQVSNDWKGELKYGKAENENKPWGTGLELDISECTASFEYIDIEINRSV